jgi:E3 ubiquitin-protein ligase HUWE1
LYIPGLAESHAAINIMATFVHNEPTSLPIIQEAGLPEAFYKAIEAGLEPVIEVIGSSHRHRTIY